MIRTSDAVELYRLNDMWHVRTTESQIIRYKSFTSERLALSYANDAAERLRVEIDRPAED